MGNLGFPEIAFIAVFALIIFGPRKLPEAARMAGKAFREFRRATQELRDELAEGISDPPKSSGPDSDFPPPGPR